MDAAAVPPEIRRKAPMSGPHLKANSQARPRHRTRVLPSIASLLIRPWQAVKSKGPPGGGPWLIEKRALVALNGKNVSVRRGPQATFRTAEARAPRLGGTAAKRIISRQRCTACEPIHSPADPSRRACAPPA
jgi:hypothetical protein